MPSFRILFCLLWFDIDQFSPIWFGALHWHNIYSHTRMIYVTTHIRVSEPVAIVSGNSCRQFSAMPLLEPMLTNFQFCVKSIFFFHVNIFGIVGRLKRLSYEMRVPYLYILLFLSTLLNTLQYVSNHLENISICLGAEQEDDMTWASLKILRHI